MYGKHFVSMYEGSMMGAGVSVFAVWGYVIAKAYKSYVELFPANVALLLGGTETEVQKAIDFLCSPDPRSRIQEHEGRRLIKEGQYDYFVVGWEKYHTIRNQDDRREYNRQKQAKYRQQKKSTIGPLLMVDKNQQLSTNVNNSIPCVQACTMCTKEEAETEAQSETETITTPALPVCKPPTVKEKKQKNKPSGVEIQLFSRFWTAYPKHTNQPAAMRAFRILNPDGALVDKMIDAIKEQKKTDRTLNPKGGQQYIPNPSSWLHGKRWEDDIPAPEELEDDEFKGCATRPVTDEEYENLMKGIPLKI
jgi:hypothetical protein